MKKLMNLSLTTDKNVLGRRAVVALAATMLFAGSVLAIEELAPPTNAVADAAALGEAALDDVVLAPGERIVDGPHAPAAPPVSPYDVVPYEADPAVRAYSGGAPSADVSAYAPAFAQPYSSGAPHPHHAHAPAAPACCEPPKIRYWNHPLLAAAVCPCDCTETIETYLSVPCQCCPVMVKVCVPACCVAAPQCETGRDLLGRKTYEYCWPCGYRVKVVDRHTGTLVVHTFNP